MEPTPSKRQRRANWSSREVWTLLEEVRHEKCTLMCGLSNDITNAKKKAIWATVAQKVTAVGGVEVRTAQNVREKWGALKSESQRRRDNQRATGGGAVKSGEYDSIIYDILGEDTALTTGVDVEDTDLIVRTASAVNPALPSVSANGACSSNQFSSEDISPPLTPLDVVISVDVSKPKDMPSVTHVPAGRSEEMQPPSKNRQGLKKTASQSLKAEYFRSHIHRNNFAVEKYKSDIELNNIRIEVLKKQLQ